MKELIENLKIERRKYDKYKIIKNIILNRDYEEGKSSENVYNKAYSLVMASELKQCLDSPIHDIELGLASFKPSDLLMFEKEQLQDLVQRKIEEKKVTLQEQLKEYGIILDFSKDTQPNDLTDRIKTVLDLRLKVKDMQQLRVEKLQELTNTFEEILKLQTEVLPLNVDKKIAELNILLELNRIKTKILNCQLNMNIFKETSICKPAYAELLTSISQEQNKVKTEVQSLQKLQMQYKEVSCREYNEILEAYSQYKRHINKQSNNNK